MLLALAASAILYSCASTGNPSGGPKDETPPQLTSKSTPSGQTNFEKQELEFYFDEFVNVKNPAQQVLISPPLTYPLQFDHRGKRLRVNFHEDEVLRPDATYSINFGEAIEDFRESNKMENFQFVFATGDKIDSLSFSGSVKNSETNEPAKGVIVMLYDTLYQDSIPYLSRPYYFAKTAEDGTFTINNIKQDTFKVVALGDNNLNYVYDEESELFGYTDSLYILTDSTSNSIALEVWQAKVSPLMLDSDTDTRGIIRLAFDQAADDIPYSLSDTTISVTPIVKGDSLLLLYPLDVTGSFKLNLPDDTIRISPARSKSKPSKRLAIQNNNANLYQGILKSDSIFLEFATPIVSIDTSKIRMFQIKDTLQQEIGGWSTKISTQPHGVMMNRAWSSNDSLTVSIDSASITDIFGAVNDSLGFDFRIDQLENRSQLELSMSNIDSTAQYVIRLLLNNKEIAESTIDAENNTYTLIGLLPGKYEVEVIEDKNRNGEWDTGNYLEKKQPEIKRKVPIEELRANWEVKSNINWREIVSD